MFATVASAWDSGWWFGARKSTVMKVVPLAQQPHGDRAKAGVARRPDRFAPPLRATEHRGASVMRIRCRSMGMAPALMVVALVAGRADEPASAPAAAVFGDRLWILGGWFDSRESSPRDVWSSADGRAWKLVQPRAAWRHDDRVSGPHVADGGLDGRPAAHALGEQRRLVERRRDHVAAVDGGRSLAPAALVLDGRLPEPAVGGRWHAAAARERRLVAPPADGLGARTGHRGIT